MFDPAKMVGKFDSRSTSFTLLGGANKVCSTHPNRVGLFIANHTGQQMFASLNPTVTSATGAWVWATGTTLEIIWARHGYLTTLAWYVAVFQAGLEATVTELYFWPNR